MSTTSGSVQPNFVGVGVPRAGSTWIHRVIDSHPLGFAPQARKEIHYFDRNYDRGHEWYLRHFQAASASHVAVGEFTPHYFYSPQALDRIQAFQIGTALVCLRDPVQRLWSNYQFKKRQDGFTGSLAEFLIAYPEMERWSRYDEHIEPWLDRFGDDFHILVYETIAADGDALRLALEKALGLTVADFPDQVVSDRVNATMVPRRAGLYRRLVRVNKWLVDRDLDRVSNTLKRLPGGMTFARAGSTDQPVQKITASEHEMLVELFEPSVTRLHRLLDLDLSTWSPVVGS